jgi:hypothetical protein
VNRHSGLREHLSDSLVKTRTLENRKGAAPDPAYTFSLIPGLERLNIRNLNA